MTHTNCVTRDETGSTQLKLEATILVYNGEITWPGKPQKEGGKTPKASKDMEKAVKRQGHDNKNHDGTARMTKASTTTMTTAMTIDEVRRTTTTT